MATQPIPALPFCHVRLSGLKPLPKAYPKRLKTLGDHIRKRRLDLGLLQREVAAQLGVNTASIGNWEINETRPMVHCLPGIIAFLGHNPLPEADDLIGKLKRLRGTLGLTQEKLGQELGIDESTIAGWERGDNTPVGPYRKLLEDFLAADGSLAGRCSARVRFSARKIIAPQKKAWAEQSGPCPADWRQREHSVALGAGGSEAARSVSETTCGSEPGTGLARRLNHSKPDRREAPRATVSALAQIALSASTLPTTLPPNRIDAFLGDNRNHHDPCNRISPPPA
jgi:transcriptional regulator with XRE-family HTH domain